MRAGARRAELDATLRAAYAEGLLSDDTFAARAGVLLATGPLHPERVVGDVTLRGGRTARSRLRRVRRLADRRRWPQILRAGGDAPLLALDWSGATETLLVGRGEGCGVMLDDPVVSRRHAQLTFRDGTWVVRDLGSRNGTTLNGVRIGRARLEPGDLLEFAGARFRVD